MLDAMVCRVEGGEPGFVIVILVAEDDEVVNRWVEVIDAKSLDLIYERRLGLCVAFSVAD